MTPDDFECVCRVVRERAALVLEPGKEYLVETRLGPLARELKLGSITELVARLRKCDPVVTVRVTEAMVTTETSFFRDVAVFEALRLCVIPELIARRVSERRLDIWCAASSTGQEPYSLAMMLREHFPQLAGWSVSILATDLSTEVLGRARAGRYGQLEVNRGLPAAMLLKYFRQHGDAWELTDEIRRAVQLREMNLTRPWPALPRMDLVLLRNVMIYFDAETKKGILKRVGGLLRPEVPASGRGGNDAQPGRFVPPRRIPQGRVLPARRRRRIEGGPLKRSAPHAKRVDLLDDRARAIRVRTRTSPVVVIIFVDTVFCGA